MSEEHAHGEELSQEEFEALVTRNERAVQQAQEEAAALNAQNKAQIEQAQRDHEAKTAEVEQVQQEERERIAAQIKYDNNVVNQALEALRKGQPLQDEPI